MNAIVVTRRRITGARQHSTPPGPVRVAQHVGRLAIRSLYREVALHPKPGLVSPIGSGSHADMDMSTFFRSLFALRHYFPMIAEAGLAQPRFAGLQPLGIAAERDMLAATGGVNTHRGAIFNLGLLCAAAAPGIAGGMPLTADAICRHVADRWGEDILATAAAAPPSHRSAVMRRYGAGGARVEAASGFPAVIGIGLPARREALAATGDLRRASVQALFALIASVEDSNLLWRAGPAGLRFARSRAIAFLEAGGTLRPDWQSRTVAIHREFVGRRLSPGGSADLLAVTLFLHDLEGDDLAP